MLYCDKQEQYQCHDSGFCEQYIDLVLGTKVFLEVLFFPTKSIGNNSGVVKIIF